MVSSSSMVEQSTERGRFRRQSWNAIPDIRHVLVVATHSTRGRLSSWTIRRLRVKEIC